MIIKSILCIFFIFNIQCSEHKDPNQDECFDFTINISTLPDDYSTPPTPIRAESESTVQSYQEFMDCHNVKLKKSQFKAKMAAITAIVTTLISGGITLYVSLRNCK